MIASRSLLLVFVCIALVLPSSLARRKIKDKKKPGRGYKEAKNVSCDDNRRMRFRVALKMNQTYTFDTTGDEKKKCSAWYQVKKCRHVLVNTTFLSLNEGSEYYVGQRGNESEPFEGIISADPHSDRYVNVSSQIFTSDFDIKFLSGKQAAGKMSQVSVEISCLSGIQMKEERGDCQCGQMKLKMKEGEQDDDRDHNRPKRSLRGGELEIETPWMDHEDDSFSVTIGENYALSFMPAPEEGETPEELPADSFLVNGTQFVLTLNNDTAVQFDEDHQPACLPSMDNLRDLVNQKVFAIKKDAETGNMTALPMKVMDRYKCEDILRKSHGDDSITLADAEGCLSPHRKSKLCQDSIGSPIFAFNSRAKTNLMLIGFVSDISGECARKKTPAKFARLNNPGLLKVFGVIDELVTKNNSQPLLTCPDHPPIVDECEHENGTTLQCPGGCCGQDCCPECVDPSTDTAVFCSEGQVCNVDGKCVFKCPYYPERDDLTQVSFTECPENKVCCENGHGCCSPCNGQICPSFVQTCMMNTCGPDQVMCGVFSCGDPQLNKCCDSAPNWCCNK